MPQWHAGLRVLRQGVPYCPLSGQLPIRWPVAEVIFVHLCDSRYVKSTSIERCFLCIVFLQGWFPFRAIRPDNYHQRLPRYPPREDYGIENMKAAELASFDDWYRRVENDEFDFDTQIYNYCRDDVLLLAKGEQRQNKMLVRF
jgi:hypothetical protein